MDFAPRPNDKPNMRQVQTRRGPKTVTRRGKRNIAVFNIAWIFLTGLAIHWELTEGFGLKFAGLFLMPPFIAAGIVWLVFGWFDYRRLILKRAMRVDRRQRSKAEIKRERVTVAIFVIIGIAAHVAKVVYGD